jgi:formylglycine-generating enzyme required for sulfatase activity
MERVTLGLRAERILAKSPQVMPWALAAAVMLPLLLFLCAAVTFIKIPLIGGGGDFRDRLADGKACGFCPKMKVVPAGDYIIGSPGDDRNRFYGEGPQLHITIGRPFAMGVFHVTVDEFSVFAAETHYKTKSTCVTFEDGKQQERENRSWQNPGFAQGGMQPVVCLSWGDAQAYAAWLSHKVGHAYRLPTEAEWEYAARATTKTQYSFGDDEKDMCRFGNGADQTARSGLQGSENWTLFPCRDGYVYTAPVGTYLPNAFGLYDMHGNAWQWLEDCWHENYQGMPRDGTARLSGDCTRRVLRGGSYGDIPRVLRTAYRNWAVSSLRGNTIGFRVARDVTP